MLLEWGVRVRVYQPIPTKKPAFPSMHCKSMLIDNCAYVVGLANMTTNGLHNNTEVMIFTRAEDVVAPAVKLFDELWTEGADWTVKECDESQKRLDDQHRGSRSASQGPGETRDSSSSSSSAVRASSLERTSQATRGGRRSFPAA